MAVVITCGLRQEWCDFGQSRISEMGIIRAQKAERVDLGANELLTKMCKSTKTSVERSRSFRQVRPGKTWQILAADLFLENSEHEAWGWADPNNIFFLEFWRDFDPECQFVLVYGSLAQYAAFEMTDQGSFQSNIETITNRWENYHNELMRFYHENEEQCILINVSKFDQSAREIARGLNEKFAIETRLINTHHVLDISPLKSLAAQTLLKESMAASQIFPELENTADIPSEEAISENEMAWKAVADYEIALKQAREANEALEKIEYQLAEQEASHSEVVQSIRSEHETQLKDLTDAVAASKQELYEAQNKLSEALELAKSHESKLEILQEKLTVSQNQLQDSQTELISLRRDAANTVNVASDVSASEQGSNNELLLLQLTQVQEELNYYFQKYTAQVDSDNHEENAPATVQAPAKKEMPKKTNSSYTKPPRPNEWLIDLRKYVNGKGWHSPEMHGRWAGLETKSTVKVRALNKAPHKIEMKIIDAVSLNVVNDMIFKFEGEELKPKVKIYSDLSGSLAPLRRLKASVTKFDKPFPMTLTYQVSADLIHGTGKGHWIEIIVPETRTPSDEGLNDFRDLSICVETIKVTKLD